jgi:WD40 repeat protein
MKSTDTVPVGGLGFWAGGHTRCHWSAVWIGFHVIACAFSWLDPLAAAYGEGRPVGEQASHRDIYGDRLPPGTLCRLGTVRFRHLDWLHCVTFSPDGKILASISKDDSVRAWDLRTGEQLLRFPCPGGAELHYTLCFSPDGRHLAFPLKDHVVCVDLMTGKETQCLHPATGVTSVVYSPDGTALATGSEDGTVRLWDAASGNELRVLRGHARRIYCIAFSPNGKTLVSGGLDRTSRFWNVSTGELLRKTDWQPASARRDDWTAGDEVFCLAYSPDGKTVAIGVTVNIWEAGRARVHLCDAASGKTLRRFPVLDSIVHALAFSPDGAVLAGAAGDLFLWDVASGREVRRLPGHGAKSISFSPDGRILATGGNDPALHLWDIASATERERPAHHLGPITCVAFTPDGNTVGTVGADLTLRLWEAATGRQRLMLQQKWDYFTYPGSNLCFSPDGRSLVCQHEAQALAVHDVGTGRAICTFPVLDGDIQWFTASPDGKVLAVRTCRMRDGESWIQLLDMTTGKVFQRLPDPTNRRGANFLLEGPLTFSPDGKVLATSFCNSTIRLYEPATGKELRRLQGHGLTFSPNGRLLASTLGGGMLAFSSRTTKRRYHLWDVASAKQLWVEEEDAAVFWGEFAPDGRSFVHTDINSPLGVYESASGKALLCFPQPSSYWTAEAFSPDAQCLATGHYDGTAFIWDLTPQGWRAPTAKATPEQLQQFWRHLAGEDTPRAHRAVYTLAHHGGPALAFLRDRLKPVPKDYAERLRQRIADLDSDDIRTRESAMRELTLLGPDAVLPLHAALDAKPSREARNRIEELLKYMHPWYIKDPDTLRTVRAIWALQLMATPEARAVLDTLAAGAPEARITQEAQAALRFLDRNRKP